MTIFVVHYPQPDFPNRHCTANLFIFVKRVQTDLFLTSYELCPDPKKEIFV